MSSTSRNSSGPRCGAGVKARNPFSQAGAFSHVTSSGVKHERVRGEERLRSVAASLTYAGNRIAELADQERELVVAHSPRAASSKLHTRACDRPSGSQIALCVGGPAGI